MHADVYNIHMMHQRHHCHSICHTVLQKHTQRLKSAVSCSQSGENLWVAPFSLLNDKA